MAAQRRVVEDGGRATPAAGRRAVSTAQPPFEATQPTTSSKSARHASEMYGGLGRAQSPPFAVASSFQWLTTRRTSDAGSSENNSLSRRVTCVIDSPLPS